MATMYHWSPLCGDAFGCTTTGFIVILQVCLWNMNEWVVIYPVQDWSNADEVHDVSTSTGHIAIDASGGGKAKT